MGCFPSRHAQVSLEDVAIDAATWSTIVEPLLEPGAGCAIPKTEERAITLAQLRKLRDQIEQRCVTEGWRAWDPKKKRPKKRPLFRPKEVSLYVVCEKVIKPATEAKQCSFVEVPTASPVARDRACDG